MTHAIRFVSVVAVLTTLVLCVFVQAQTPEIDALRARAEAGVAEDQYIIGHDYSIGFGVPQDDAEAVRWFRLAADQGHADAQFQLWIMYAIGQGVPKDHQWVTRWIYRDFRGQ
jgi:hypothetical protein